MSDARLRELERRWKETGSVDDEAAYLLERVRVGDLTRERLEWASYLGHPAAIKALGAGPLGVPLAQRVLRARADAPDRAEFAWRICVAVVSQADEEWRRLLGGTIPAQGGGWDAFHVAKELISDSTGHTQVRRAEWPTFYTALAAIGRTEAMLTEDRIQAAGLSVVPWVLSKDQSP